MTPLSVLRDYFGYESFRAGQEALVGRILAGGDVLGIMPTGAGKSVCYQVPAMLLPGLTVVISPLISLMQDQVTALRQQGIPAACLHSNLTQEEYFSVRNAVLRGELRLLYTAPERLLTDSFLALTAQRTVSLVAVDEAHCLSQWGQDFRPHYLEIAEYLARFPQRPVVAAFTATATADVRGDIRRLLGLREPLEIVTGFDRENLRWSVQRPPDKYLALKNILERNQGKSGIVYCLTRKLTDEICGKLCRDGYRAAAYHAGLDADVRTRNQDAFIRDEIQIIVATNAFGMGIDKSNVSYVVHYNMPKSMEAYYQEAGRAGRDGSPAECILLFSAQDIKLNQFLIEHSDAENDRLTPEQRDAVRSKDMERLDAMARYCRLHDCLRAYILRYFGEEAPAHCGNCSVCLEDTDEVDATVEAQKILSCIYHIRARKLGCGMKLLCDILTGSRSEQVEKLQLHTLSTYGIMQDTSRGQLEQMTNILISRGCIADRREGMYRMLCLPPNGKAKAILRGEQRVTMPLPKTEVRQKERAKRIAARPADTDSEKLFQALRRVREKLAVREGVPAYIVCSDASLRDMAAKKPATANDLLGVSGIGKYKAEKYGDAFLDALADWG